MDAHHFDTMSRQVGAQTDRRQMLTTAAGGTLALLGIGGFSRAALGQEVEAERGWKGQQCKKDATCRKGLVCNLERGRCEYARGCGGRKNDACQKNRDCCAGFQCRRKKCKRR